MNITTSHPAIPRFGGWNEPSNPAFQSLKPDDTVELKIRKQQIEPFEPGGSFELVPAVIEKIEGHQGRTVGGQQVHQRGVADHVDYLELRRTDNQKIVKVLAGTYTIDKNLPENKRFSEDQSLDGVEEDGDRTEDRVLIRGLWGMRVNGKPLWTEPRLLSAEVVE